MFLFTSSITLPWQIAANSATCSPIILKPSTAGARLGRLSLKWWS